MIEICWNGDNNITRVILVDVMIINMVYLRKSDGITYGSYIDTIVNNEYNIVVIGNSEISEQELLKADNSYNNNLKLLIKTMDITTIKSSSTVEIEISDHWEWLKVDREKISTFY
ncbi:hypothetical protein Glove_19g37 [Diversispora epigaea]|uniref:Uncharacterized protein n=1 Tax=Diversispora epigaea TaxID=1348612 RepID=A0A397JKU9_9GLOM|nr:hypothetical protein Glove_19g37 [Diversispora epigaea]